jgi:hypothetical protein
LRRFPIQSVLLAGVADELLRVLRNAAVFLSMVLILTVRQRGAYVYGGEFIAAYASRWNLFFSGSEIDTTACLSCVLAAFAKAFPASSGDVTSACWLW